MFLRHVGVCQPSAPMYDAFGEKFGTLDMRAVAELANFGLLG